MVLLDFGVDDSVGFAMRSSFSSLGPGLGVDRLLLLLIVECSTSEGTLDA